MKHLRQTKERKTVLSTAWRGVGQGGLAIIHFLQGLAIRFSYIVFSQGFASAKYMHFRKD